MRKDVQMIDDQMSGGMMSDGLMIGVEMSEDRMIDVVMIIVMIYVMIHVIHDKMTDVRMIVVLMTVVLMIDHVMTSLSKQRIEKTLTLIHSIHTTITVLTTEYKVNTWIGTVDLMIDNPQSLRTHLTSQLTRGLTNLNIVDKSQDLVKLVISTDTLTILLGFIQTTPANSHRSIIHLHEMISHHSEMSLLRLMIRQDQLILSHIVDQVIIQSIAPHLVAHATQHLVTNRTTRHSTHDNRFTQLLWKCLPR